MVPGLVQSPETQVTPFAQEAERKLRPSADTFTEGQSPGLQPAPVCQVSKVCGATTASVVHVSQATQPGDIMARVTVTKQIFHPTPQGVRQTLGYSLLPLPLPVPVPAVVSCSRLATPSSRGHPSDTLTQVTRQDVRSTLLLNPRSPPSTVEPVKDCLHSRRETEPAEVMGWTEEEQRWASRTGRQAHPLGKAEVYSQPTPFGSQSHPNQHLEKSSNLQGKGH